MMSTVTADFLENDWFTFFNDLSALVECLSHRKKSDEDELALLKAKVDEAVLSLLVLSYEAQSLSSVSELESQLRTFSQELSRELIGFRRCDSERLAVFETGAPLTHQDVRKPGRPRYAINEDTLLHFRDLGFSWKDIAAMMLVSRWTISRRVDELGLKERTGFSKLTDQELDEIVSNFKFHHGLATGRSMVIGHLKSIGIRVQKARVTKSLVRVDPVLMTYNIIYRPDCAGSRDYFVDHILFSLNIKISC